MIAAKTTLCAEDLPDNLREVRAAIERAAPHGKTFGKRDQGAWTSPPNIVNAAWAKLEEGFSRGSRVLRGRCEALRRFRRGCRMGAGLCTAQLRSDDAERRTRSETGDHETVRCARRSGQLSSQLREPRTSFRRGCPGHAQGRGPRAPGRARHRSRQHGRALVHRARSRE